MQRRFRVYTISERCKSCGICVDLCPPKILVFGEDTNAYGYRYVVVTDESKCIGCKICELHCPDFAIYIKAAREEVVKA